MRLTKTHAADQKGADSSSRTRLSIVFTIRIDKAGESRSRYQNVFHHAGTTMIASPRNTARRARSANFAGAIGLNRSQSLRLSATTMKALRQLLRRTDLTIGDPDLGAPVDQLGGQRGADAGRAARNERNLP
jgi:hypothetical protein